MTIDQKSLWNQIERFSLDEPGAAFPFSRRLADENRWSAAHAQRAIREYKRFMFLGCVAGHPVSPSEDVDQVWHLHLAYTKSYWQDFCGEILKRPFHHNPTKGGAAESAKFKDWYANTLGSYRKFFEEEPPSDLWPAQPSHHELKWIDTASNWVVPKPKLQTVVAMVCAALLTLVAAWTQPQFGELNVFELRGPGFLNFFLWFSIVVIAGAAACRAILIRRIPIPQANVEDLDAYEVAYLSGKGVLATNAAIMGLVDRKIAAVSSKGEMTLLYNATTEAPLHPLERAIVEGCDKAPVHLKEVRGAAKKVLEEINENLEKRGLLFPRSATRASRFVPLFIALIVPLVGIVKIALGIIRDKPVAFLVMGTVIVLIVIAIVVGRRPFRTRAGDQLLGELREENRGLRKPSVAEALAAPTVLPLAIALFGMQALATTPYRDLRRALTPQATGDNSSGCGSSCGGGCGGGCGGCGGCGGD